MLFYINDIDIMIGSGEINKGDLDVFDNILEQ